MYTKQRLRCFKTQCVSDTSYESVCFTGKRYCILMECLLSVSIQCTEMGSVVVARSPGMRVKQKTLKYEVLLLCLALSTKELETDWPTRSQDNGLGWGITAYPWGGVSVS